MATTVAAAVVAASPGTEEHAEQAEAQPPAPAAVAVAAVDSVPFSSNPEPPSPPPELSAPAPTPPSTPKTLSIMHGDPGRRDPFAVVWVEWYSSADMIRQHLGRPHRVAGTVQDRPITFVRDAWQWGPGKWGAQGRRGTGPAGRHTFDQVAADVARLAHKVRPHVISLETNNEGHEALAAFHASGAPELAHARGIACTAECSEDTMRAGSSFSKNRMVEWCASQLRNRRLVLNDNGRPEMSELRRQLSEFKEYKTLTGATSYVRMRGRHDDLALAMLGACSYAWRIEMEWRERVGPADPTAVDSSTQKPVRARREGGRGRKGRGKGREPPTGVALADRMAMRQAWFARNVRPQGAPTTAAAGGAP